MSRIRKPSWPYQAHGPEFALVWSVEYHCHLAWFKKKKLITLLWQMWPWCGEQTPPHYTQCCCFFQFYTSQSERENILLTSNCQHLSALTVSLYNVKRTDSRYDDKIFFLRHCDEMFLSQVDGLSLLAASISHWLRKSPVDVPHILLATNFHSLLQMDLLPSSELLSLLVLKHRSRFSVFMYSFTNVFRSFSNDWQKK